MFVTKVIDHFIGSPKNQLCDDLILHQLDCFGWFERRCLFVASCLSTAFTSKEIKRILNADDSAGELRSSVETLVQKDILRVVVTVGPSSDLYDFRDSRWRKTILEISLHSSVYDRAKLVTALRPRPLRRSPVAKMA